MSLAPDLTSFAANLQVTLIQLAASRIRAPLA